MTEWLVIACGIIIVCAFAIGVVVGVCMGMDMFGSASDDIWEGDDFHV